MGSVSAGEGSRHVVVSVHTCEGVLTFVVLPLLILMARSINFPFKVLYSLYFLI